jgi:hypothetical protein
MSVCGAAADVESAEEPPRATAGTGGAGWATVRRMLTGGGAGR